MAKNKLTTCKACGNEIARGVKRCVHCGKKQGNFFSRHKILTVLLGVLVIVIIVATTGGKGKPGNEGESTATNSSQDNENKKTKKEETKVNYENFLSINMGMTYEEVVAILGEGEETTSTSIGDTTTKIYSWKGKGISNSNVTVQNDSVVGKAQAGLNKKDANITLEKYESITDGMTYEQVKEIIGEGEISSQTKVLDMEVIIYSYVNKNGSSANFTFNNDSLKLKAQFGLK